MALPRMRTAPKAIEEIKQQDPDTSFTERALRRKMNSGEIPCVCVGGKKLVNMDVLYKYLSGEAIQQASENTDNYGKIRRIV